MTGMPQMVQSEWLRQALRLPEGESPFPWQLELLARRVDIAPDGTIYGLELLNANEQLQADNGALVLVNEAIGERREIRL